MRNRILAAIMVAVCFAMTSSAYGQLVGTVEGNAQMLGQNPNYIMLVLPAGYQTDPVSQDLLNGFNSDPTLVALRGESQYVVMDTTNPDYKERWAKLMPQVDAGQPGVLITSQGQKMLCQYGASSKQIAAEAKGSQLFERMGRCRPCQPQCTPADVSCRPRPQQPKPEVKPNPVTPITPTVAPIQPTTPMAPPVKEEANRGLVLLVLGGAVFCVYALGFRYRMT